MGMCDHRGATPGVVPADPHELNRRRRQASLEYPDGVVYLGQLWDQVKAEPDPLRVVFRAGTYVFFDVQPDVYWCHGRSPWRTDVTADVHELFFILPPEVVRRVQERHARTIVTDLLGYSQPVRLPAAVGEWTTDLRTGPGDGFVCEVISSWPMIRQVIQLAVESPAVNEPLVRLHGGQPVSARVHRGRIEICLDRVVPEIHDAWSQAFRARIGIK